MYKDFFGLKEYPFSLTPDPRFIVFSPSYNELLAAIYYGVDMAKGLIVLTGEAGTGKTTALRWIIRRLEVTVLAAYIHNPPLSIDEFYRHLTEMLGIRDWTNKTDLLMKMGKMLEERHRQGLRTLLIVDEAHELPDEVLEEIRRLLNFESDSSKHLQIILTGQPELREKLNQQNLRQLKHCVALRCHMPILSTSDEVKQYIQTRMSTGGSVETDIFTPEAVDLIYKCSQGIPRLINNLCDNAMISAFSSETRSIDRKIIEEVAENLDLLREVDVPLAAAENSSRASGSGS
jgi:general secretion pathway protein A